MDDVKTRVPKEEERGPFQSKSQTDAACGRPSPRPECSPRMRYSIPDSIPTHGWRVRSAGACYRCQDIEALLSNFRIADQALRSPQRCINVKSHFPVCRIASEWPRRAERVFRRCAAHYACRVFVGIQKRLEVGDRTPAARLCDIFSVCCDAVLARCVYAMSAPFR